MSARLKRNAPLLRALCHATPRKRKDILNHCSSDFLQSLCKLSLNLLKGNVPLTLAQCKKFKRRERVSFTSAFSRRSYLWTASRGLIKQGEKEEHHITLTLPKDSAVQEDSAVQTSSNLKLVILDEMVHHEKLTKSQGRWTPKGKFVHKGEIVKGLHVVDFSKIYPSLIKNPYCLRVGYVF